MLINYTPDGFINICEHDIDSDEFFKRAYSGYTLRESKKLFKREFSEFKKERE